MILSTMLFVARLRYCNYVALGQSLQTITHNQLTPPDSAYVGMFTSIQQLIAELADERPFFFRCVLFSEYEVSRLRGLSLQN